MHARIMAAQLIVLLIVAGCSTPPPARMVVTADAPVLGIEEEWCELHHERLIEELLPMGPDMSNSGCSATISGELAAIYFPFPHAALWGGLPDELSLRCVRHCRTCSRMHREMDRERWARIEREGPRKYSDG